MKSKIITTILLLMFTCLQSVWGYSSIWNVDGWDVARLKEEGITVRTWKQDQIGEEPTLSWVEITYDFSKLKEDQDVTMTLQVIADNRQTVSAHRAEHKKGDSNRMKLLFAVSKENVENSYVILLFPKLLSKAAEGPFADPGFAGYNLGLKRIMQLAGQVAKSKPIYK